MSQAVPNQHPAVVLRSHFNQLRALLAAALIALIALAVAVVILASDENQLSDTSSASPIESINYSGFNPATGRPDTVQRQSQTPGTRYDGGPDEGTRGPQSSYESSYESPLRSYRPAPAASVKERVGGPEMMLIPQAR